MIDVSTWGELIDRAATGESVAPVFQPIVDIERGVVAGYEALARFTEGPPVSPDHWFAEAARRGRGAALEAAVLQASLARRSSLPPNTFLSVNVEPESLLDPTVMRVFSREGSLAGLVVEVTEHRALGDPGLVVPALERLRAMGAMIAVDDAGAGYAGLQQILTMRPQFLKLDRALVTDVDADETKAALIEMLGVFANRLDAWVIAEGVETVGEASRCRALGIPLAQGWFYARPGPPWVPLDPSGFAPAAGVPVPSGGLHQLVNPVAPLPIEALSSAPARFEELGVAHLVVTRDGRPVGLLTPDSTLDLALLEPLVANVRSTPAEIANRLALAAVDDRYLPVIVTDDVGVFVGTVPMPRLLRHLAEGGV